jgi:copper chaperone NosL
MRPVAFGLLAAMSSCTAEPQPIDFGKDNCTFCKMTVIDKKFGAELINKKGKVVKFDSGECMLAYIHADKKFEAAKILIINYANPAGLIDADKAYFLHGGKVNSPMGGQLAAFKSKEEAEKFQKEFAAELLVWSDVKQISF